MKKMTKRFSWAFFEPCDEALYKWELSMAGLSKSLLAIDFLNTGYRHKSCTPHKNRGSSILKIANVVGFFVFYKGLKIGLPASAQNHHRTKHESTK